MVGGGVSRPQDPCLLWLTIHAGSAKDIISRSLVQLYITRKIRHVAWQRVTRHRPAVNRSGVELILCEDHTPLHVS